MKNLNLVWNQLFYSKNVPPPSTSTSAPSSESTTTTSTSSSNSFGNKFVKIIDKKKLLSKLKLKPSRSSKKRRRHSDSSVSVSGSSHHDDDNGDSLDSLSSCSALSFVLFKHHNKDEHHQQQHDHRMPFGFNQLTLERRAISCFQIDDNNNNGDDNNNKCDLNKKYLWYLLNENSVVVPVETTSTTTTSNNSNRFIHPFSKISSTTTAECDDPSPSRHLKRIESILEEDEEESESGEEREAASNHEPNNKMFDSDKPSQVPLRPTRRKLDRIEPFQKPDDLKPFWQQPKEALPPITSKTPTTEVEDPRGRDNDRRKSFDANKQHHHHQVPYSSSSGGGGGDGRNSSASNFIRTNILRSSCPPPSRRRKSTDNIHQQQQQSSSSSGSSRMIRSPSQHANHVSSDNNNGNGNNRSSFGLVDAIHTKINSAVRKSWLSSLFNSFNANNNNHSHSHSHSHNNINGNNSKEKRSKWKKSDDFKAEFFDRQSDLITESLLNRRSPLNFNVNANNKQQALDLNRFNDKNRQKIAPSSFELPRRPTSIIDHPLEKTNHPGPNPKHWIESALHEPQSDQPSSIPSFIRPNSTSAQVLAGLNRRPRPRSACLDNTYMLRMRNGNFIEFTSDSEGKDETCSIISSHQYLATTSSNNTSTGGIANPGGGSQDLFSINHRNNNHFSEQFLSPKGHDVTYHHHQQQQPQQQQQRTKPESNNFLIGDESYPLAVDNYLKRQSNPIAYSVRSNSMISSPPPPSSSFSRPTTTVTSTTGTTTTTTTTTTTATSISTTATGGSSSSPSSSLLLTNHCYHHNQQQQQQHGQPYSFSTKTSFTSTSSNEMPINQIMDDHSVLANVYWPFKNRTEIQIQPEHSANDVIERMLTSQIYAQFNNLNSTLVLPEHCTRWAYALRMVCRKSNLLNDHVWIHPTKNMHEFIDQNQMLFDKNWKLELRIRYVPFNLEELYRKDFPSFKFLYEQILDEFLAIELTPTQWFSNQDLIIELGCYEIFRTHPYLTPQALDKNSNWETLENDFHRIFPISFITSLKPKQLRKLVKTKYKKTYLMGQEEVVFNFLKSVKQLVRFHQEVFQCSLGESIWSVPVELIIGPSTGIAYFKSKSTPSITILKFFEQIEQINIVSYSTMNQKSNHDDPDGDHHEQQPSSWTKNSKKILLNLRIKNTEDLLNISCPTFSMAQSIADLIDGYHRLATDRPDSIWTNVITTDKSQTNTKNDDHQRPSDSSQNFDESISAKSNVSMMIEPKKAQFDLINIPEPNFRGSDNLGSTTNKNTDAGDNNGDNDNDNNGADDGDYSNPAEVCLEIDRDHLRIEEIIGTGQFGDVHRGMFLKKRPADGTTTTTGTEQIPVAIKISRVQSDSTVYGRQHDIHLTDQKLLCEAERMHKLDHHNIIKLIGVCSSSPVYVAMELAEYGELRSFLSKHGSQLEQRRLIEYSYQIASAMAYLESKQFVHRDIAARNVLVFSFDCVKLADFGLSRYIEDASYYMATNSKLPIKWMAPESINFRRFTTASDVWMFGVCVWEIFMLGKKPFPGVKNSDVIGLIECGDRLAKPSRCPEQLYELMLKCWRYEPDRRPTFRVIKRKIYDVYQNELGLVGAIARADIVNDLSSSKSSLSSISAGKGDQSSSTSSSLSRMHLQKGPNAQTPYSMAEHQKKNLSQSESNLSLTTSPSCVLDATKIKEILDEQRKQMEEDQRWLQQNEFKWQSPTTTTTATTRTDSLPKSMASDHQPDSEHESSIYEDADCDNNKIVEQPIFPWKSPPPPPSSKFNAQHLYSVPNLQAKSARLSGMDGGGGDGSYNSSSFKSTRSSLEQINQSNTPTTSSSTSSSMESKTHNSTHKDADDDDDSCGPLSVSLQKFFKHNKLTNAKVRQEMMEKVNCASAQADRQNDPVYWSSINVVNTVRYLLKGVQELNTTEYIDLVKNVGLELRNLLANVDLFIETIPEHHHRTVMVGQKKLSTDMNDLVESMKQTITYSDTPMQGAYKQNMLEASYVLVIDSKNLMDTVDEIRSKIKNESL